MPTLPQNISIRRARDADLPEMARIHKSAYPGFPLTMDQLIEYFRSDPRISLEDRWVCQRADRLVGIFNLFNFRQYRMGEVIPVGGIGGVAVAPHARKERIAYWMMLKAVQIMEQNGVPLSTLYPFRHGFYRKLGWGLIVTPKLYKFDPATLPAYEGRERVQPVVTDDEQEAVMVCYNEFASQRNGLLQRDDPIWLERVFKNNTTYAYIGPTGKTEGYVIYEYDPLPAVTHLIDTNMDIHDLVWTNQRAFRGLISFLGSQADQVRMIRYFDMTNLPFAHILKEPACVDAVRNFWLGAQLAIMGAGYMGRVIQLKRVLTMLGKTNNIKGTVTLMVKDELNEANSEPLAVDFGEHGVTFPRSGGGITLSMDMATFSSIYWGALRWSEALWLGLCEQEGKGDVSFLDRIFAVSSPMCMDYF